MSDDALTESLMREYAPQLSDAIVDAHDIRSNTVLSISMYSALPLLVIDEVVRRTHQIVQEKTGFTIGVIAIPQHAAIEEMSLDSLVSMRASVNLMIDFKTDKEALSAQKN